MAIITLPEMPLAGNKTAEELKRVCVPATKCSNLNNWLNELYAFRVKYNIYKEELKK